MRNENIIKSYAIAWHHMKHTIHLSFWSGWMPFHSSCSCEPHPSRCVTIRQMDLLGISPRWYLFNNETGYFPPLCLWWCHDSDASWGHHESGNARYWTQGNFFQSDVNQLPVNDMLIPVMHTHLLHTHLLHTHLLHTHLLHTPTTHTPTTQTPTHTPTTQTLLSSQHIGL